MDRDVSKPSPKAQWIDLAEALGDMRDSLVMVSLALHVGADRKLSQVFY